jgi:hypothetical protein
MQRGQIGGVQLRWAVRWNDADDADAFEASAGPHWRLLVFGQWRLTRTCPQAHIRSRWAFAQEGAHHQGALLQKVAAITLGCLMIHPAPRR